MSLELRQLEPGQLAAARELLAGACTHDAAADVAEEKLYGRAAGDPWRETLAAWRGERLAGVAVVSGRWLRLLAVAPDTRGTGVGSALLDAAESAARAAGESQLRTLDQPGNYLAPGVAVENTDTIAWLERRGYARAKENQNLLIRLPGNARATPEHARELATRAAARGYEVRRAGAADLPVLTRAIAAEFSAGWAFEVESATRVPPGAVHVAFDAGGSPVAFAAHDGNNRGLGWFGPAGTWPAHRGRGLGEALLAACLADVAGLGHEFCTIAWIGPRGFYERSAGVDGERRFLVLAKELSQP